ncbi:MAG: DUF5597 domain-containing protein [Rikenellaceae bacterium]|nr:DUF5597 domain-containing protein [Rikenellaceae bacterium]
MKNPYFPLFAAFAALVLLAGCVASEPFPRLEKRGASLELMVDDAPYLILGGEVWNSASSSLDYMAPRWDAMQAVGINTVLLPLAWESIEPQEGVFDFTLLDGAILEARKRDMRIVLLWFGSWKNSMSCYAPCWVKESFGERFELARTAEGRPLEIMSAFSETNCEADRRAFVALMSHLKNEDLTRRVVMVQVENEIGMLQSARDYSEAANAAYRADVPREVVDLLLTKGAACHPRLYNAWQRMGAPMQGSWEVLFGAGIDTEEFFQAYHYAKYVERIASAGREVYPLPLYANAALNSRGRTAGAYPSAGPLPHLSDLWHLAAPTLDFLSPDIYDPLYPDWLAQYAACEPLLFIPEIQYEPSPTNGARAMYAVGEHRAIGFSPYAADDATPDSSIASAYPLLQMIWPLLQEARSEERTYGLWFDRDNRERILRVGDIELVCRHDLTLGWSPEARDESLWSETGAVVVDLGDGEFLVAGTGVVITLRSADATDGRTIGIAAIDEVVDLTPEGSLRYGRRLNGDEDHQGRHLRIPFGEYGAQHLRTYSY